MAVSCDERSFRPSAQDSFDAYATPFIAKRYPLAQGNLSIVADAGPDGAGGVVPNPHGRALRCGGLGSYLEDAFFPTTAPDFPTVYPDVNQEHRDQDSVLCSVWVNVPANAGAFTLIEWWGVSQAPIDPEEPDAPPDLTPWTICRLDVDGDGLTFEGGETLAAAGALPLGEWCQVQFRVSMYSGDAGAGQALNTAAVRVAVPGYAGATVLGQDEVDGEDGWQTVATKFFDVPPFVRIQGVRVGMLPAGASGAGDPEAFITLDDYCAGSIDLRYLAALVYPPGQPCDWMDGLWVECCPLTGPAEQAPLERTDPGGVVPWEVEGAATSWEAVDELPAHDGDATRLLTPTAAQVDGFAHAPVTQQFPDDAERIGAVSLPCFGAQEAGGDSPRYSWCQTAGVDNTLDQSAEEAEHYNPLVPPEHAEATEEEPAAYGCGVPLWWGPQMPHPVLDEEGLEAGQYWYYEHAEVDATEVFLQAPAGHFVTSLAVEVSHTTTALLPPLPPPGGAGVGRSWAVWWPEG